MIYRKPTAEIIEFDDRDIIVASGQDDYCPRGIIKFVCEILIYKKSSREVYENEMGPAQDPFADF